MPTFTPDTPRVERKFSGIDFTVPYVFTEGHPLTKGETAWLNSNLASVVGNAFSGDIRRGINALTVKRIEAAVSDPAKRTKAIAAFNKGGVLPAGVTLATAADLGWNMQSEFDTKFADYVLGESNRGTGGGAASPIDQLVRMFSTVDVKARLAKKGLKVGPLYKAPSNIMGADGKPKYPSKWEELVSENIITKGDEFRKQAEEQLAALAASDDEADDLLAGLGEAEAPATETPPEEPPAA